MSRFDVAAVSVAMLLWSVAMMHTGFSRTLPWVGAIIGAVGLLALFSGHLPKAKWNALRPRDYVTPL